MPTKKKPTQRKPKLTPRQKKLIALIPKVEAGEMTMKAALLKAGYSEESSDQQSTILGGLRRNARMQEALQKAGFTEEYLAKGVMEGTQATMPTSTGRKHPDYKARGIFYKMGAELMDAFPAQKQISTTATIDDLIKAQETTPEA
jgi:hypothetical protein